LLRTCGVGESTGDDSSADFSFLRGVGVLFDWSVVGGGDATLFSSVMFVSSEADFSSGFLTRFALLLHVEKKKC